MVLVKYSNHETTGTPLEPPHLFPDSLHPPSSSHSSLPKISGESFVPANSNGLSNSRSATTLSATGGSATGKSIPADHHYADATEVVLSSGGVGSNLFGKYAVSGATASLPQQQPSAGVFSGTAASGGIAAAPTATTAPAIASSHAGKPKDGTNIKMPVLVKMK